MTDPTPEQATRLWPTDTGTLHFDSRRALVKLVQGPYVSRAETELWRAVLGDEEALRSRLSDMFLVLTIDEEAGTAFVRNAEEMPTVVKNQKLSFIATAILLQLRSELLKVDRADRTIVSTEEIKDAVRVFAEATRTDEADFTRRFNAGWKMMKDNGVLVGLRADSERFEISPALRLIFDSDEIKAVQTEFIRLLTEHGVSSPFESDVTGTGDGEELS